MKKTLWLIEGYGPNGGNHTVWQIGKTIQQHFDITVKNVHFGRNKKTTGLFYGLDETIESFPFFDFRKKLQKQDILLSHGSFSKHALGLRFDCTKIMYVQGFSTFKVIDGFFDHYVAVSDFVQNYLRNTYRIQASLILPFIKLDNMPKPLPWEEKKEAIFVYPKFNKDHFELMFPKIEQFLKRQNIEYDLLINNVKIEQTDLHNIINRYKYFMSLSVAEGFGLVPLEAMHLGCVVLGFDGFGGRSYMKRGENCLTVPYPQLQKVIGNIRQAFKQKDMVKQISEQAQITPQQYSLEAYNKNWIDFFEGIL